MTLSGQSATTGLIATATATGPAVTWKEKIGGATTTTLLPLATTGYECSGTFGASGHSFTVDVDTGSGSVTGSAVAATGTITYGSPTNGDTVTVNGTVLTKAASGGAAAFSTIAELEALIEALTGINASENGTVVTITAATAGAAGNAITLAKTGSALTLSGATLSGGVDAATLLGADGKDIEGVTLTPLVKVMGVRIECVSGEFNVEFSAFGFLAFALATGGIIELVFPSGTAAFISQSIDISSPAADSAFKITVLGSIV